MRSGSACWASADVHRETIPRHRSIVLIVSSKRDRSWPAILWWFEQFYRSLSRVTNESGASGCAWTRLYVEMICRSFLQSRFPNSAPQQVSEYRAVNRYTKPLGRRLDAWLRLTAATL